MKKITLLTSLDLGGNSHDDHLLVTELEKRGYHVQSKAWETFQDDGEDLFVIRTTWNYTDHLEKFVKFLEGIEDRLWNPLPLIKWNANKKYLYDLYNKGLGVIPLFLADDEASLVSCLDKIDGDDFIAKPLVSASAKGLVRFSRSELPKIKNEMIIQKFYPEILEGEASLMFFNGEFGYGVRKIPKSGEFRVQDEYGGSAVPYTPTNDELELSKAVLKEVPCDWLYARVDIIPGVGLIELECIEPCLFFSHSDNGAKTFADAISKRL
jgi:glutathione synthase/RimK-type ligase-like ATP-grasp enzyme